ncbi:MAG: Rnase Y domain-containing protein, partial [Bacteroidota bacterium]
MDNIIIILASSVVGIAIGFFISRVLLKKSIQRKLSEADTQKQQIIKDGETAADNIKKDRILEAKEKYLKLKAEFDEESNRKKNQIISNENKLKQRESNLSKQIEKNKRLEAELESQKENLDAQQSIVKKRKTELEKEIDQQIKALEKVASLTAEEAREQLVTTLTDEART